MQQEIATAQRRKYCESGRFRKVERRFIYEGDCVKSAQDPKNSLLRGGTTPCFNIQISHNHLISQPMHLIGHAIGDILSQGKIGKDLPIAYVSRVLNKAEQNYSIIENEYLAIVFCTKHFRPYLYERKFTITMDYKPLVVALFN